MTETKTQTFGYLATADLLYTMAGESTPVFDQKSRQSLTQYIKKQNIDCDLSRSIDDIEVILEMQDHGELPDCLQMNCETSPSDKLSEYLKSGSGSCVPHPSYRVNPDDILPYVSHIPVRHSVILDSVSSLCWELTYQMTVIRQMNGYSIDNSDITFCLSPHHTDDAIRVVVEIQQTSDPRLTQFELQAIGSVIDWYVRPDWSSDVRISEGDGLIHISLGVTFSNILTERLDGEFRESYESLDKRTVAFNNDDFVRSIPSAARTEYIDNFMTVAEGLEIPNVQLSAALIDNLDDKLLYLATRVRDYLVEDDSIMEPDHEEIGRIVPLYKKLVNNNLLESIKIDTSFSGMIAILVERSDGDNDLIHSVVDPIRVIHRMAQHNYIGRFGDYLPSMFNYSLKFTTEDVTITIEFANSHTRDELMTMIGYLSSRDELSNLHIMNGMFPSQPSSITLTADFEV